MAFTALAAAAVDAKSPIDEDLMELIKSNLDDLDARANAVGAFDYQFKVNGPLQGLINPNTGTFVRRNRVDGGLISKSATYQACRILLNDGGTGGDLEVDVRKATLPDCEITAVNALFRASIQSIARAGSSINTQSISRATSQITTQSIAKFKTQLNISSIVDMGADNATGTHYWKINLSGAPDADFTGQSVKLASTTAGTNDGNFTCVRVMDDGGNNVVIANASGAVQASAAGTLDLNMWKYTFTNPVDSHFAAAENCLMASHTNAANDGSLEIYAINQSGNNIVVKNTSGVAQAGVAGTADTKRFKYVTASAVSATDYVVGESILTASHTTGANDGTFPIKAVNDGGNNVVVYNTSGATQGGVAGTINTCRWVYAFSSDPATSSNVVAGDSVIFVSATTAANNGTFTAKEVDRSAGTNIVVHNTSGVAQGGAVGTCATAKKKVSFASAQAGITTDSRIFVANCYVIDEDDYTVVEVNRGGGSNYNAIISTTSTTEQDGRGGRIPMETKSLFDTRPKLTVLGQTYNWHATHGGVSSNMVLNSTRKTVAADTPIFLDIISAPTGSSGLTVQLL